MDIFLPWIKHAIEAYGYLGVFGSQMLGMFGLPVPDETILTFTGFLIFKGIMQPAPAFLAAYLGSVCGISLNYLVGRYFGFPLLHRYGPYLRLAGERIDRVRQWFEHYGKIALFAGYFFPGLRHLSAFAAGASRLEFRQFAPYAYSGGFCWVATFLSLGYVLGEEWRQFLPQVRSYLWLALGVLALLSLTAYLIWRRSRSEQL